MTDKAISTKQAAEILGVSTTTFWRQMKDPTVIMPKPFKVSLRRIAYSLAEVHAVLSLRRAS